MNLSDTPQPAQRARRLRVLFVEDNAELREVFGWMLEQQQLDAVMCASGEEALAQLASAGDGAFDILMTDISLPQMSGVELARRLLQRQPAAWVVFCSGYPMQAGLAAFGPNVRALPKPFDDDDLRRLVDEVRGQGGGEAARR